MIASAPRETILVVDDEPFNRDLLVQELDEYETKVASNGAEALALVASDPPDLILLDVMMPGLDGFEVCRRLKAGDGTRFIPIVIMTALDAVEDRVRGIEAGADDFLTKPVDERQLMARIRTALRAKHDLDRKLDLAAEVARSPRPARALGSVRACTRCNAVYSVEMATCSLDGAPVKYFDRDPLVGRQIDRYVILDRLGAGGMGCVYVAAHATMKNQRYAIKIPFGELAGQPEYASRFVREAEACARLVHPNIVSVLDFGRTPEGLNYMVMEFVAGRTLREVITAEAPMPFERAAPIARQIAEALGFAHERGLLHRDVKPANLVVIDHPDGMLLKLLDFGVVLSLGSTSSAQLTAGGFAMGTPLYMAPEQITGATELGPATDLYALGVTLYEMIGGQAPFDGAALKVAADKLRLSPLPLRTTTGLDRLTWSLLSPRPQDRPASAAEVIAAIDEIAAAREAGIALTRPGIAGTEGVDAGVELDGQETTRRPSGPPERRDPVSLPDQKTARSGRPGIAPAPAAVAPETPTLPSARPPPATPMTTSLFVHAPLLAGAAIAIVLALALVALALR